RFLPHLARFVGHEELGALAKDAGVDASVCVQAADCEPETDFMLAQAAEAGFIAGVVGWVPLADPAATERAIARHRDARAPLVGVRHLIHDEPDPDWVVRPAVLDSLRLLADAGLAFDLSAFQPRHLEHVATIAAAVPALRLVVCHFGMPGAKPEDWEPWATAFARAAAHPHCVVKVSGLDMYRGGCDVDAFRPYFDFALEHFGAERMIWASNWPVSLQLTGYAQLLETARAVLAGRSPAERDAIFGGNAIRTYRLPL
ncbi:MAG: amidohydrolase family protein, partial [Myxococcales bacterium]|nr:amidohydrolase family protein [Myxococcales bacterium]